MSLKNRIIFMMTLVVTAFFGLIYTIQNHFLINNLNKIEREEITKNLKRCAETIRKEYSHIDISCYDWARWDDMYNYVLTRGEAFEKSNLNNSTMEINQLNGFFIIGNNGELIWGKSYDLKKETDISVKEFPYENWPLDHPLLQIKKSEGKLNGLFITEKGAVLVSSRPILKSNNEGPAVGTLIMFRFLQDKVIHSVEKQLNISIKLFDLTRDNIPHIKNIAERVCSKNPYLILKKKKGDLTRAYILLNDIDNKPCLLAETVMYMEITEQAYTLLRFGIFSILWGSVIILVVMSIFLQRSVINPVIKLKNHIKNIKRSNNLSLRIESGKNDEIGILAREFNDLLYRLNKVITELQTARKDIQESENYLKKILDSIQTGVILIDKNNKCIMDVNNYVIKLINVQKDSLILTPLNTFLQRAVNLDDNRSQTNLHENIIIDSNGREIPILFSFVNIENKNKSYYILNFIDMTDYKKIEDELLKIRKLESLGILAGGIAHDFNNLLAAILGNISLAISDMDEKTGIYRFLKNAETASNKARDLSQQLLTFSKGGMPVKKTATIQELIKNSALFAVMGQNIVCEFDIEENIMPIEIDKTQISQVINNLVINAIQAMPQGGTIKIKCRNRIINETQIGSLPAGKYVEISIIDHGMGIDQKNIGKIFDPYFTTKKEGHGLGLATCYSIMKKHSGCITVESEQGFGSTFRIYLPVSEKEFIQATPKDEKYTKGTGRILIMDDDPLVRETIGEIIKKIGYEIDFSSNGNETINLYRINLDLNKKFDAVIMDLTIPGSMGGKDTLAELKKIDPEVKAIVASGYSNDPVMADYKKYGFMGIICKPFTTNDINNALLSVLNSPCT